MNKNLNKIEKFFNTSLSEEVKNFCMFKTDNGYELFCRYEVFKQNGLFHVRQKYNYTEKTFSSLINAFSWCVFDHRNKILKANALEKLDNYLNSANFDITLYSKLLTTKNLSIESESLYLNKLNEGELKKKRIEKEINFYNKEAILWQEKQLYAQKN
jgi:hypothetical protein